MTDSRVLEELISIKEEAIRSKDAIFTKVADSIENGLGEIEVLMEEEHFFPAEVLKRVRDLKKLIKIAR